MTDTDNITIAIDTETRGAQTVDCGHEVTSTEIVTGYAIWDGRKLCYACSDERTRQLMAERGRVDGYLSCAGMAIITWSGGKLLTVTRERQTRRGAFGVLVMVRAVDEAGRQWWGRGPGRGMCITMRRCK